MRRLPLEGVFDLGHVKEVCRTADGYQPHLVSPERGLKLLAAEALAMAHEPVRLCCRQVHTLLLSAAKAAAASAGQHTEAAAAGGPALHAPRFASAVMPVVVQALEEWREEAERGELWVGEERVCDRRIVCTIL